LKRWECLFCLLDLSAKFTLIEDAFSNKKELKTLIKENEDLNVHEQLIKHLEEVKKSSVEKVNYHERNY